jgi:hypothetical protein
VVRFAAMASTKNTIILGCFILAAVGFQTWMQLEHSDRYERVPNNKDITELVYRFDKWTGHHEFRSGTGEWVPVEADITDALNSVLKYK